MKKLLLTLILGNALILWIIVKFSRFVGKVMTAVYRENPEPFRYVWLDVFIPALKNTIVDTVEQGVKRTVYGPPDPNKYRYQGPRAYTPDPQRPFYAPRGAHRGPSMPTPEPTVGPNGD